MSIQSDIDAAPPGGTVNVAPGIYNEQLIIDKPLTLSGPIPPAGEAIIDASGLTVGEATIHILAQDVIIENLTLQNGPGQGIRVGDTGFPNLTGVIIRNNIIKNHNLAGILTANGAAMVIKENSISNNGQEIGFQRVGVFLYPHGESQVLKNNIESNGSDGIFARESTSGLLIADNVITNHFNSGITLAWDETNVTIRNNTITACGDGGSDEQGGIVIIQSMAEIITGNTIGNSNPSGIHWGWTPSFGPPPPQILISENTIANSSRDGLFLFSQGPGGFIPPDPFPLEPTILDNQILNNGRAGIYVSNLYFYSPGNANPVIHDNNITGNGQFGVFNGTAGEVDATDNWWGSSSGPFHPTENPQGTGDPVSDNVLFVPWQTEPFPVGTDCLLLERILDHCFTTNNTVQRFPIPQGLGEPCANLDLNEIDRIECAIVNNKCHIVDSQATAEDNLAIITIGQEVEMEISLLTDSVTPPAILCSFTARINDLFSQVQLRLPTQGPRPYISCEPVKAACLCSLETPSPNEPPTTVLCTLNFCQIIESRAPSRLLITHYGYCPPEACPPGGNGDGCPPSPPR